MISRDFRRATCTRLTLLSVFLMGSAMLRAQNTSLAVTGATDLGPVPSAEKVVVRLYLTPDAAKVSALDQFLLDVQEVGSGSYHRWLTPAEFGARFGPDAAVVARVRRFAEDQGLKVDSVSASGLRLSASGTATQVEAMFAPGLHAYAVGERRSVANTQTPVVPQAIAADVRAVSGFQTVTADVTATLDDAVEANSEAVVPLVSGMCLRDVSEKVQAAFVAEAKQAAAQGIAVLATAGCGADSLASFPAALDGVTAVVMAPGMGAVEGSGLRPVWQSAFGLPPDGLRHTPDLMVADLQALVRTLGSIAASAPAGRLGNVGETLYRLAPIAGLFTQPDAAPAGTWEAQTGLGLVDLKTLTAVYPRGSSPVLVSGTATNYAPTHGQSTTLISTVSDISGTVGSPVPTGTLAFLQKDGTSLGTATLANGSGSLTTNLLPGGTNPVIVTYSGDSRYSAGQGTGIYVTVLGEPAAVTATVGPTVGLGENSTVAITVTSASGVGTPTGTVTVTPQGVGQNPPTYSMPLVKTAAGTAAATVTVPALQAGAISLLVNCVSADLGFTCYVPVHATAIVKQATSTLTFTATPNGAGTSVVFVGKVTGAAAPAPAPTGPVAFYDNGTLLGTATLTAAGTATYTSTVSPAVIAARVQPQATAHAYTASYFGDVNYQASAAAAPNAVTPTATTTALTVSPNPPVSGTATTLTATLAYTSTGTAATGTVQFFQDAVLLGTGTVSSAGVATLSSTAVSGTAAHSFYAAYGGDSVYAASQSAAVTTQANTATVTTTTSIAASASTVNTGSTVTLTATVTPTTTGGAAPSGTVSFTSSTQGLLGTASVSGTTATLAVTLTTAGAQAISASYGGDATYKASTTATPVSVTVGTVVTPVSLAVSPAGSVMYSNPVTVSVSVAGVATTTATAPAGSVVFTVTAAGTALPTTATVAIAPSSATAGVAAYTFAAPAPGTYTISAVCAGTNFTCSPTAATAKLVTVKGSTVTTVSATPPGLVAGQPTTLIATVTPGSALATATDFTGTVTFYDASGTALGTATTLVGNQASLLTTFATVTGNVITAVYSGDVDWSGSTSAALKLVQAVSPTTTALSTNYATALLGNNEIFTFTVTTAPTTQIPLPAAPAGQVVLYDQFNGQTITLATLNVSPSGPYTSVAQFATTGLFAGLHTVTAVFVATPSFATSTSNVRTVNVTDFTLGFSPQQLTLARGASGGVIVTVAPVSGFAGTVSLTCAPPPDTLTTCAFSPSSVPVGGSSTLTIGTTAARVSGEQQAMLRGWGMGVSAAALLGCLFMPRRRRPMLAGVVLLGLIGVAGCGQTGGAPAGTTAPAGGSPLGTQSFTITSSGADGTTTNRHNAQFQLTIQ